jgi:hypothetical protein
MIFTVMLACQDDQRTRFRVLNKGRTMAAFVFTQHLCDRPVTISIYTGQSALPEKYRSVHDKMPNFRWFLVAASPDSTTQDRIKEWALAGDEDDLLSLLNDLCDTVAAEFLGGQPGWLEDMISRRDDRDN